VWPTCIVVYKAALTVGLLICLILGAQVLSLSHLTIRMPPNCLRSPLTLTFKRTVHVLLAAAAAASSDR
jgi:hypothetical protein